MYVFNCIHVERRTVHVHVYTCMCLFRTRTNSQLTLSDAVHKVPELIPGNARLYPTVDVEDMGFPGTL